MKIDVNHPELYQLRDGYSVVALYPSGYQRVLVVFEVEDGRYSSVYTNIAGKTASASAKGYDLIPKPKVVWRGYDPETERHAFTTMHYDSVQQVRERRCTWPYRLGIPEGSTDIKDWILEENK